MTAPFSRADTIAWLQERRDNALRISRLKQGADRDGWIEDACYFNAAIVHLGGAPKTLDAT